MPARRPSHRAPRPSRRGLANVRRIEDPEQALQRDVAEMLDRLAGPNGFAWFAVPNGGKRNRTEAAIFKALGVKAGVADIVIVTAPRGRAFFLELKSERGRASPAQLDFRDRVTALGAPYGLAKSLDDVAVFLRGHGIANVTLF